MILQVIEGDQNVKESTVQRAGRHCTSDRHRPHCSRGRFYSEHNAPYKLQLGSKDIRLCELAIPSFCPPGGCGRTREVGDLYRRWTDRGRWWTDLAAFKLSRLLTIRSMIYEPIFLRALRNSEDRRFEWKPRCLPELEEP